MKIPGLSMFKKVKDITKLQKDLLKEMKKITNKYKEDNIDYEENKEEIQKDLKDFLQFIYKKVDELKSFTNEEKFQSKKEMTKKIIKEFKKMLPDLKNKSSIEIKRMFNIPNEF